jgi:hypothetical protein
MHAFVDSIFNSGILCRHDSAFSPRVFARVFQKRPVLLLQRAQGMPGAQCTRSLVRDENKHTSIVTTVTPEITRHSPRNGFTAYAVLSPASEFLLSPSPAD